MPERADSRRKSISTAPAAADIERKVLHTCRLRLESLLIEIQRTTANVRENSIHDLRVAIRRGTEVLHIMQIAGLQNRRPLTRLIKGLRSVRRAGGAVRDCDVLRQMLTHRQTPGDSVADIHLQMHDLTLNRTAALNKLTRRLHEVSIAQSLRQTIVAAVAYQHHQPDSRMQQALARRLKENQRKFKAMICKAAKDPTGSRLHQTRIAGKHWRYALELLPAGMDVDTAAGDCPRRLSELKTMQELLGNIHDLEMLEAKFAGQHIKPADTRSPAKRQTWRPQTRQKRNALVRIFFQTPLAQAACRPLYTTVKKPV